MHSHEQRERRRLIVALTGLIAYGVLVGVVTLAPKPVDRGFRQEIASFIAMMHRAGVPDSFGYTQLEFSMNILMFVPLGFCVALALPAHRQWIAWVTLPALSIAIESVQLIFLSSRFATISDVVANSLGGWIGALIAAAVHSALRRKRHRELL